MLAANPTSLSKSAPVSDLYVRRLPRPDRRVGVYPERLGAFSSPNVDALDAASSVSPLSAALTKNTRGWVCVPLVNPNFQFNRRLVSNSHRIRFFAHPYPLTPIESYSCKKQ